MRQRSLRLLPRVRPEEVQHLLAGARLVVSNGGSTLIHALAHGKAGRQRAARAVTRRDAYDVPHGCGRRSAGRAGRRRHCRAAHSMSSRSRRVACSCAAGSMRSDSSTVSTRPSPRCAISLGPDGFTPQFGSQPCTNFSSATRITPPGRCAHGFSCKCAAFRSRNTWCRSTKARVSRSSARFHRRARCPACATARPSSGIRSASPSISPRADAGPVAGGQGRAHLGPLRDRRNAFRLRHCCASTAR